VSLDPLKREGFRRGLLAEAEKRRPEYERAIRRLLPQLIASTITKRALKHVELGESGKAQAALRRPSKKVIRRLMREVRVTAWLAGLGEAEQILDKLPEPEEEERFADPLDEAIVELNKIREERRRRLREKLTRGLARNPEARSRPVADVTTVQTEALLRAALAKAREEIAREIREAKEEARKQVQKQRLDAAKAEATRRQKMLERAEMLRRHQRAKGKPRDDRGRRFNTRVTADVGAVAASTMEVDWEVSQRAKVEAYKVSKRRIFLEFVARMDGETTPACAFLDGSVIDKSDPDVTRYTPQLHFNCRSAWRPRVSKDDLHDWDTKKARVIAEPSLEDKPKRYSLPGGVRQIKVPGGAPNVPPPRKLSEWLGGGGKPTSRAPKPNEPVGARSTELAGRRVKTGDPPSRRDRRPRRMRSRG